MTCEFTELCRDVYHISEEGEVYITLIIGEESALLIDTGYGKFDLNELVKSFTDKPFRVVVTHVHPDHARGCNQFPVCYLNEADAPLIGTYCDDVPFEYRNISAGETIDLGGKTIQIVGLPGHTPGSLGFILAEERILFAGDALNGWLWLFMDECHTLADYRKMLDDASEMPFDRYVSSHHNDFLSKDLIECLKHNIDTLSHDESTQEEILGYEVYSSTCSFNGETSRIFYSKSKL